MAGSRTKSIERLFGMPDSARTGRERLVVSAVDLIYRHGFGAVGIDQVIATAGVTKTTFYKHFAGKSELMVAAVLRRDEWERQAWERAVRTRAGDDPVQRFLATVEVMDLWFNSPDFSGCMFVNAATEFPNPSDPVHQAAAARMTRMRAERRDLARSAGASPGDAEIFADCFTALLEGAFVLRQSYGRNDAARVVRPGIVHLIDAYLRGSTTAPRAAAGRAGGTRKT